MLHPDARALLDVIDTFLQRHDEASQQLAAVLTALRGPDGADEQHNKPSTIAIRRKAFPVTADTIDKPIVVGEPSLNRYMAMQGPHELIYSVKVGVWPTHFEAHLAMAADALDVPVVVDRDNRF